MTTLQILPGSANLFGGRSVVVKNVPARTTQGMKFPGAPYGLKMACGENPKRVYGTKGTMPQTRMGNIALARETWIKAQAYKRKWDKYEATGGDMPERERDTAVLLPESQRGVRLGLDLGPAAEGTPDNIPAILVCLTKIGIRKVSYPVLLVRAIASICEIAVPMP